MRFDRLTPLEKKYLRAMAELGVDLGQGFYFGQPTDKPMAVDSRLVRPSMS